MTGFDTTTATGFSVTEGSLGLALIMANPEQLVGDNRSYLAITSHLGSAKLVGLPSDMFASDCQ